MKFVIKNVKPKSVVEIDSLIEFTVMSVSEYAVVTRSTRIKFFIFFLFLPNSAYSEYFYCTSVLKFDIGIDIKFGYRGRKKEHYIDNEKTDYRIYIVIIIMIPNFFSLLYSVRGFLSVHFYRGIDFPGDFQFEF